MGYRGYKPYDIEVVAAFDIDERKVGREISEAIFQLPNYTTIFCKDIQKKGTIVKMSGVLDGFAEHMKKYNERYTFLWGLKSLLNFMPNVPWTPMWDS